MAATEVQILFEVWAPLDEIEHGHHCSATVRPTRTVPLSQIREVFPYEGQWHFRSRQQLSNDAPPSFVWLDLQHHNDTAEVYNGSCLIRAIPLEWPEPAPYASENGGEYDVEMEEQYLKAVENILNERERPLRTTAATARQPTRRSITSASPSSATATAESSGEENFSWARIRSGLMSAQEQIASAVQGARLEESVKQLWGAVKTVAGIPQKPRCVLSDDAAENLGNLSDDLSIPPSDVNDEHIALLATIWTCCIDEAAFEASSNRWKELGFQNANPLQDLKRAGVLALHAIAYVCTSYGDKVRAITQQQKPKTKNNYPFAVVCVNVTLMLCDVLKLKDQRFLSIQANYWRLFESDVAFYELFALCLFHVDVIWRRTKATRAEFGAVINQARASAEQLLVAEPANVEELHKYASEMDIGNMDY